MEWWLVSGISKGDISFLVLSYLRCYQSITSPSHYARFPSSRWCSELKQRGNKSFQALLRAIKLIICTSTHGPGRSQYYPYEIDINACFFTYTSRYTQKPAFPSRAPSKKRRMRRKKTSRQSFSVFFCLTITHIVKVGDFEHVRGAVTGR